MSPIIGVAVSVGGQRRSRRRKLGEGEEGVLTAVRLNSALPHQ